MIAELIIWIKSNWGTVISMSALGVALRRLEIAVRHKRSNDRKAIFDRLGALEVEQSSQRSDTAQINKSYEELREGCLILEGKVDASVSESDKAREQSETILRLLKKKG